MYVHENAQLRVALPCAGNTPNSYRYWRHRWFAPKGVGTLAVGQRLGRAMLLLLTALVSKPLLAADSLASTEYWSHPTARFHSQNTDSAFGEVLDPSIGALSFTHTDVVVKGIGPDIILARSSRDDTEDFGVEFKREMGNWALSIPRIETLVDATSGKKWETWDPTIQKVSTARCTYFDRPNYYSGIEDSMGWAGISMITADGRQHELLQRSPDNPQTLVGFGPANGLTSGNWQIACLPATSNGVPGEGFLAISPDGLRYRFNRLIYATARTAYERDATTGIIIRQRRSFGRMYVTRIEDRFGNYIDYDYSTAGKLASIKGSDGRLVNVAWRTDVPLVSQIDIVAADGRKRSWKYEYSNTTSWGAYLSRVVLPDSTSWQFTKQGMSAIDHLQHATTLRTCGTRQLPSGTPNEAVVMTNPAGLTARYSLASTWHTSSYVWSACRLPTQPGDGEAYEEIPPLRATNALVRKEVSGVGVSPLVWTFAYENPAGTTRSDPCAATASCADRRKVTVVAPTGLTTQSLYSTRWDETEGKLISETRLDASGQVKSTKSFSYYPSSAGPWPKVIGYPLVYMHANTAPRMLWTPFKMSSTTVDGVTYNNEALELDGFAQPRLRRESNSMGYSRSDRSEYLNATNAWLIGLVTRQTDVGTGKVVSRTDYDARFQPEVVYSFERPVSTRTYHGNGMLKTDTDGRQLTTTLSAWKRAVPGRVDFANATYRSAEVDDFGAITSLTDESGSKTCYLYEEPSGRLKEVIRTSESSAGVCDTLTWDKTAYQYEKVGAIEYGIEPDHWRVTETTGGRRSRTYLDALLRPMIEEVADLSDPAGTSTWSATRYDAHGQAAFVSYPLNPLTAGGLTWAGVSGGTRTVRDALGRVISVSQDSEHGLLTTSTEYLPGLQVRVTNPRNQVTTTTYEAYGQPSYEHPAVIQQPLGTTTRIRRDGIGNTLEITRGE